MAIRHEGALQKHSKKHTEGMKMEEFFLLEHKIRVHVYGADYWVINGKGDISKDEDEAATYFLMSAAKRIIARHFPSEWNGSNRAEIICTNDPQIA